MALTPRFRYLRDPAFLACLAAYLLNKLVLKSHTANAFVHGYLNDCICLPLWIPLMLAGMRLSGLRRHDLPPRAHEILIPLLLWSWVFEVALPQTALFAGIATADHLDVLSYTAGAIAGALAWRWIYRAPAGGILPSSAGNPPLEPTAPVTHAHALIAAYGPTGSEGFRVSAEVDAAGSNGPRAIESGDRCRGRHG
jgi:hypothetical protein